MRLARLVRSYSGYAMLFVGVLAAGSLPAQGYDRGWEWQNPLPQGNDFYAVWGSGPNDVFMVGDHGIVRHFDGQAWSTMATPTQECLIGVWGSGPNDVYAIGWCSSIIHYDGQVWSLVGIDYTGGYNTAIWGSGSNDVYVADEAWSWSDWAFHAGILYYHDGSWRQDSGLPDVRSELASMWGTGPDNIYAANLGGQILHFSGGSWSTVDTGTNAYICRIWGSGPSDVYAISPDTILHYDGSAWTSTDVHNSWSAEGIWGSGPNDVYVIINNYPVVDYRWNSSILHYDGTTWSEVYQCSTPLHAIWGSGPDDIYAAGAFGMALHYDGNAWSAMGSSLTVASFSGIWGSGPGDIFAVGSPEDLTEYGCCALLADCPTTVHYDGTKWSVMETSEVYDVRAIWGSGPYNVFGVGGSGTIVHYDGKTWSRVASKADDCSLNGIWGSGPNDIFAVGYKSDDGTGIILHYDGHTWSTMTSDVADGLYAVWGSGPNDVHAVGQWGTTLHYDGCAWSATPHGASGDWFGPELIGVWGSGPNDVYAVGKEDAIVHYDGTVWTVIHDEVLVQCDTADAVWGTGSSDVYVLGYRFSGGAVMFHYDGTCWSQVNIGSCNRLTAMWGDTCGNIYAVGQGGTILHFTGYLATDINRDCRVGMGDLNLLVAAWGNRPAKAVVRTNVDINGDGYINILDLQLLVADWGR